MTEHRGTAARQIAIRAATTLALASLAWVATGNAAETRVDYDRHADFTRYKTWSWRKGTPAPNPVADKRLREAIESRLTARGFSRVDKGGDLQVAYYAAAEDQVSLETLGYKEPGFETEATRVRVLRVGSVLLDVIDASTQAVIWRGQAGGAAIPAPGPVERMIDEGMEKLLKDFPPAN